MKPTADELKDKPEEVRRLVAEALGWTCINRDYMVGLVPYRSIAQYSGQQVIDGEVPLEYLPEFTSYHDACRTFEDAMSPKEWGMYVALWGNPVLYMKALPIEKCLKFLIVKGAVSQSGESVTIQVRRAINP